ncbi:MAG: InlB B-repeat-containing protein [Treponema sp.]|nr:InlB B-repeat-containing protein [Treponema sp.]
MKKTEIARPCIAASIALLALAFIACPTGNNPKESSFAVTFNANGGSEVETRQVPKGSFATEPPAPTRTNHAFLGWYAEDSSREFAFATTPITEPITLTARWHAGSERIYEGGWRSGRISIADMQTTASKSFAIPVQAGVTYYIWWTLGGSRASNVSANWPGGSFSQQTNSETRPVITPNADGNLIVTVGRASGAGFGAGFIDYSVTYSTNPQRP